MDDSEIEEEGGGEGGGGGGKSQIVIANCLPINLHSHY